MRCLQKNNDNDDNKGDNIKRSLQKTMMTIMVMIKMIKIKVSTKTKDDDNDNDNKDSN